MTHDELLEMVEFRLECAELKYLQEEAPAVRALLSVAKLHKPVLKSKDKYICEGCNLFYPCETIEVIEEELA